MGMVFCIYSRNSLRRGIGCVLIIQKNSENSNFRNFCWMIRTQPISLFLNYFYFIINALWILLTFIFFTFQIVHRSLRAANQNSIYFFAHYISLQQQTYVLHKGVSDLETCVDYFTLSRRSCENTKFCFPARPCGTEKPV